MSELPIREKAPKDPELLTSLKTLDRSIGASWPAQNTRKAKKARSAFDGLDNLDDFNRLKQALSHSEAEHRVAPAQTAEPAQCVSLHLPSAGLQLLFAQPNIHGDYPAELVEQIRSQRQERCYILLAFPPKCGGTFIRDVIGRVSGAGPNPYRFAHALGGREASPYLPMIAAQMLSPTGPKVFMTHAHMIGHHANIELLNLFKIKPVVMKRSIPDMLCSFADMVDSEGGDRGGYNWSLLCGVHTDSNFLRLDADARRDFLVYHQAPWYVQFYASWLRADRSKQLPVHWATYDGFRADPLRTITGILDFYKLSDTKSAIPDMLARARTNKTMLRFNKGVTGRGATFLMPHHVQHLHRLAAGYPDIDFVSEGLLPPLLSAAS